MSNGSERSTSLTRRQLLAAATSVAGAGIAGCSSRSSPGGTTNGTGTATDGTANGTTTAGGADGTTVADGLYSGETIPPTDYGELAAEPPTVAAPAAGADNPVLTAEDVDDFGRVDYVADPYLFVEGGQWHMFFEVVNGDRSPDAVIGHATSTDGLDWEYTGVAVEKQSHTSYPYVWKWQGEYYMAPADGTAVDLWRASSFPTEWERVGRVLEREYFTHDPVFFRHGDRWWLFTSRENEDVMAFHSAELTADGDGWTPHEANPLVSDRQHAARQGGRPVVIDDTPYLFFQDLEYEYGDQIRAFEVRELTTDSYDDAEVAHSPVVTGFGSGWNARKMHHYDPWSLGEGEGWRCAVDGATGPSGNQVEWGIGIFDAPDVRDLDPSVVPYDPERTSAYVRLLGESPVAVDDSGSQNHGMVRGTKPTSVGACPGRRFGSESDRVVFPTKMETLGSEAFTLFFRGRLRAPEKTQALFAYTSRHVQNRLAVRYDPDADGWRFDLHGGDGRVQPEVEAPVSPDQPFQLALSYERGEGYRIVQDGTELTTARDVGDAFHEVCLPVVGSTLPGQFSWRGDVSHVGVFDDALGPEQLTEFTNTVCSSK